MLPNYRIHMTVGGVAVEAGAHEGIDYALQGIRVASAWARRAGFNARFAVAAATHLPFGDRLQEAIPEDNPTRGCMHVTYEDSELAGCLPGWSITRRGSTRERLRVIEATLGA